MLNDDVRRRSGLWFLNGNLVARPADPDHLNVGEVGEM
jgi:hypothetical protein